EVYSDSDRSFYYRSKFFDENNGYLTRIVSQPLDYGTTLIKTTNGGATWQDVVEFSDVRGLYIHDMDNIIYFFPDKKVLRTSNGGKDWTESKTLYDGFYGVYFLNLKKGYISESGYGSIQVTNDGGATWELDTLGFYGGLILADSLNFYLRQSYRLYKSINGGDSWFKLNQPSDSVINYFFINKDKGFAIGRSYYFAKTTDGGYTWTQYSFNVNNPTYLYELNKYLQFSLEQNYPNPFNPTTKIKYTLSKQGLITIKVYDVLGKEIAQLVNEEKLSGEYEVEFDGSSLSSGIYYYKIQAGEFVQTKKMVLMK
ncbi:MAG TPA: T9SS type A sorting domain-containing protein, partial [Ignavibacteriaceae bacterium]|nr:T9SS type A sorting domain-containing protein [Ignavibacteriaceae bacterium]